MSNIDWIARTDTVGVRINTLEPGQATPWHFHTQVTDTVFGLDQTVTIRRRDPERTVTLDPGQRHDIAPGQIHQVANQTARPLRYLLIQATGVYDFNVVAGE